METDIVTRVIEIAPNMIGLIFAIMIMSLILKNEWARYERLQQKYDALQAKTIDIALRCKDEDAKAEMAAFQRSQFKTDK